MTAARRNYGFGRRMDYAGRQVLLDRCGGGHHGTVASHADRWSVFCQWAAERGIKDMRRIDAALVAAYAADPRMRKLAVSTRQNYISAINTVMTHASDGAWKTLSPRTLAGEARSTVRTTAPASLDIDHHAATVAAMRADGMDRAAAIADLAQHLGVRSEEAVKADLLRWYREAEACDAVNIIDGTKGGRDAPRWVSLTEAGHRALAAALAARPTNSRNLLAPEESYEQAVEGWIRDGREAYAAAVGDRGYHAVRAAYACTRYRELTGHDAPVVTGRRTADRDLDRAAREVIAQELGHNRIDVVAAYVGSRR